MMIERASKTALPAARARALALAGVCMLLWLTVLSGRAEAQKAYSSADAAANAFIAALRASDGSMTEVMGDDYKRFIPTEGVEDEDVQRFLSAWDEKHELLPGDEAEGLFIAARPGKLDELHTKRDDLERRLAQGD